MKAITVMMALGACLTVTPVRAEFAPAAVVDDGWGTRVEVGSTVDYSGVERSYLEEPDIVDMRIASELSDIVSMDWHPDGKTIYFTDRRCIYRVPVEGGEPGLVYEDNFIYPYQEKRYVFNASLIHGLAGISPDGSKLYFVQTPVDEDNVSVTDSSARIGQGPLTLKCLDLATKETNPIAVNAAHAVLSRSGRYLAWRDSQQRCTIVRDLVTEEERKLSYFTPPFDFTADEQYLVHSQNGFQFEPVQGGDPVAGPALPAGTVGVAAISSAPNGNWMLFTGVTDEQYHNSGVTPGGGNYSYNKPVTQLCLFNPVSSAVLVVLPASKSVDAEEVRFSPDGKQFCYIRKNSDYEDQYSPNRYDMVVKTITLPESDDIPTPVADAAPVAFGLTGNYPNPFNPSTTISFTLPAAGATELTIYDVTGRKVRELVSGTLPAGKHGITWDGRDDSGATVSSGVYLSRLRMGALSATGRLLLVK